MSTQVQLLKVEKKFLAYLFHDKKYIAMAIGKVDPSHLPNNNYIFKLVMNYYNKYKGIVTEDIADTFFQKKNLDVNTIVNYKTLISELRSIPINGDAEFEALMDELQEYKKRSEYVTMAQMIVDSNPKDCPTDKLKEMEEKIKEKITTLTAETTDVRKEGTIRDSAQERMERYKYIKNNPEVLKFIPTGFNKIDKSEGGFRPGELIYIIGRKGDGKSVLILNLAHNAWAAGKNVILFTLEVSKEDYERRFDARAAGISTNGLKMGTLTEIEEGLFKVYCDNLEKNLTIDGKKCGHFYVVDCPAGCTPSFIDSKVETVEQLMGIKFDMIASDYAGIMIPDVACDAKRHEQGQIALAMKRIARSREAVVVSAAQMTRAGKNEGDTKDGKIGTEHVAESDQISDHIDWGIAIRSISDKNGKISSFKTRDASPFEFNFNKRFASMTIQEIEDDWDAVD
jgi:replicative DNA helicase